MKPGRFQLIQWLFSIFVLPMACHTMVAADVPFTMVAGDLELTLRSSTNGIVLEHLRDTRLSQELLAPNTLPLFTLKLHRPGSTNEVVLAADRGWRQCQVKGRPARRELRWSKPIDAALAGLSVTATATADAKSQAICWQLRVENNTANWSLWRVVFPQVALADLGTNGVVLFPLGPGQVQRGVWSRQFNYGGHYPDGWCTMQFMGAYREGERASGLYVGAHDPWGGPKELALKSEPATRSVRLSFDHPAADLGRAGNDFLLEGEVVWRLLRGDWFDAATFYKGWAMKEAKWWPRLKRDGRTDTPRWMRELNAWAMIGGGPDQCVATVEEFRRFLSLPIGFHWYNWHQIPFDNDYPHYFPTKDGFAQGVARLRSAGVFPMPYINGRLWDSHDRGTEDYEFSQRALAGAVKNEDGSPYLETYGSKETNGQPVRLAVMCPSSPLWQKPSVTWCCDSCRSAAPVRFISTRWPRQHPSFATTAPTAIPWVEDIGGTKATGTCSRPSAAPSRTKRC